MNGQALSEWRKRMGLTQAELAASWKCTVRSIQHYEAGTRAIPERIEKACRLTEEKRRRETVDKDDFTIPDNLARTIKRCLRPTIDVAASAKNALTPMRFLTREQNALAHSWQDFDRAYANVPFSLKEQFCWKAWEETQASKGKLMVSFILPSGPGSGAMWFRNVLWLADRLIFLPRIKFADQPTSAPFECVLALYGARAYEQHHATKKPFHLWGWPYLETKCWLGGREQPAPEYARVWTWYHAEQQRRRSGSSETVGVSKK
jgi:transcriptional regulator with XRE-family HTH domain